MKKSIKILIAVLVIALIAVGAYFGISYALQTVSNTTTSKITTGTLNGEINETYTAPGAVYPSEEVDKDVKVQNTGTLDSLVKVTITKKFGSSRADAGEVQQGAGDDALNASYIKLLNGSNVLTSDNEDTHWYEKDDCKEATVDSTCATQTFYYKGVLESGQTTESLMTKYQIDPQAGNEYQGKLADIKVEMEMIQATSQAAQDIWSLSSEEVTQIFGTISDAEDLGKTTVTFESPTDEFDIKAGNVDLFKNFKNLMPGTTRTQTITIANNYTEDQEFFLRAETTEQTDQDNIEKINKILKEYATITVKKGEQELYKGPIWGNLESEESAPDTMKADISLGTVTASGSEDITVQLSMSSEMDNEYQNLTGEITWRFSTTFSDSTVVAHYYLDTKDDTVVQLHADETQTGLVGTSYTTQQLDVGDEYEFKRTEGAETSGTFQNGTIYVTYYYDLKKAEYTESTATKTSTLDKITAADQLVPYTIDYKTTLSKYYGKATVTIVDTLPAPIDEAKSQATLNGGVYSDNGGSGPYTLTFTVPYETINTYKDNSKEIHVTKSFSVVYKTLDYEGKTNENNVNITLALPGTPEEYGSDDDTKTSSKTLEVEVKGRVNVNYYYYDGTNKTTTTVKQATFEEDLVGETYTIVPPEIENYSLVVDEAINPTSQLTGQYTVEPKTVNLYYESKNDNSITVTKQISDLWLANGEPTFIFKLDGDDINKVHHTYYQVITFKSGSHSNTISGELEETAVFANLVAGTYTLSEVTANRYSLGSITGLTNGTSQESSVKFTIGGENTTGAATFINNKTTGAGISHSDIAVNNIATTE